MESLLAASLSYSADYLSSLSPAVWASNTVVDINQFIYNTCFKFFFVAEPVLISLMILRLKKNLLIVFSFFSSLPYGKFLYSLIWLSDLKDRTTTTERVFPVY